MPVTRVKNVNPLGAVRFAAGGVEYLAEAGEVITVPSDVAGEAPRWRRLKDDEARETHLEYREHAGHDEVFDLGHGLLAQLGNWETPTPPKPETPAPSSDAPKDGE